MKTRSIFLTLTLSLLCYSQSFSQLSEVKNFGTNPGKLKMYIHTQMVDSLVDKKPLVFVLHGCGQTAEDAARLTGWNKLAQQNNFYLVYPQQSVMNNSGACFNWFKKKDIQKGMGECASIFQMLEYMKSHYPVDENRVFITGLSAGGAMTTVMLSTYPDQFAAGAVFAGGAYRISGSGMGSMASMVGVNLADRQTLKYRVIGQNPSFPGPYPKLIVYHGLKDPVVHPKNADVLVLQWTAVHNGSPFPARTDSMYRGNPELIRSEFENDKGETVVITYKIKNMGHQLPIKPGNNYKEGGQLGLFGKNIGFHSPFETAVEFGIIRNP